MEVSHRHGESGAERSFQVRGRKGRPQICTQKTTHKRGTLEVDIARV